MKNLRILSFVSLIIALLFITPLSLYAESNATADKNVKCLEKRDEDAGDNRSLTWHDPPSPKSLNKYLKGSFSPGSTVYAVACIGSGAGRICSTGNNELNNELFNGGVGSIALGNGINVAFNNPKQEIDNTGEFKVDAVVGGTTQPSGEYFFYGVEVVQKVDTTVAGAGALQQNTFNFVDLEGKNCTKIAWTHHDPYGIVFDSVSLEPLGNVVVTINNDKGQPLENSPVLFNNKPTAEDGVYNYLVPPGKYIMTVQIPNGYKFSATPKSNPNIKTVYDYIDDNDQKSHCTVYKPGEIIDEKADMPECRNIPLEPVTVPPTVKDPVSMLYSVNKNMDEGLYIVKGKVSHPLATIIAYQTISTTQKVELARKDSNNSGFYQLDIPLASIAPDAPLELQFVKSPLMGTTQTRSLFKSLVSFINRIFVKDVSAQTSGGVLILDPLPTYIEGYAFDGAHQIIPNATVEVVLKDRGSVYYQTTADENGYFFIAPKNLPSTQLGLEFTLRFVTKNGEKVPYKLYEFSKANKYFFTKEGINLLTGMKNGKVAEPQPASETDLGIIALSPKEQEEIKRRNAATQNNNAETETTVGEKAKSAQPQAMQQIIIVLLVLVVLGVVGAVVAVSAFKKKSQF